MGTAKNLSRQVKKVFITGGGGFVGKAISRRLLSCGVEVHIFGRNTYPDLEKSGAICHQGDIAELQEVRTAIEHAGDIELIFHIAAKAGVWGGWEEYYRPNCLGTENILAVCKECQAALVYTSTPSVVFNRDDIYNGNESLPYAKHFLCNYAKSKTIAEKMVLATASSSFFCCALRPHLIWGPGDPHLLPRLVEAGRNGKLKQVGPGINNVDISYIDNVAEAHLCAALTLIDTKRRDTANGKAYFIGQQKPVNLWNWVNTLFAQLDIAPVRKGVSFTSAYRIGAIMEGLFHIGNILGATREKEPPMTRFVAEQLAKSHNFSHKAACDELGYRELISTQEGLQRSIEWLQTTAQ